ncbi:MAG: fibronectin type III domain-containing protein [bacterium]|nr:fibronectin type III domain-containing protein [bacterium]
MKKITIFFLSIAMMMFSVSIAQADSAWEGKVIKSNNRATLYYVGSDGKRYVYPNENTFKSWFNDFSVVEEIDDSALFEIPLGGNVVYRPGVVLIKIQTSPKVFAVGKNGLLRWIKTEALARAFYGENWNKLIDDVPDSFFTNYKIGDDIDEEGDYDPDTEVAETDNVDENQGRQAAKNVRRAHTKRCQVINRVISKDVPRSDRATEALQKVQERLCKTEDDSNSDETEDKTAPVISDLNATSTASTATITWTTNEAASSKVEYATESLSAASDKEDKDSGDKTLSHSLTLTDLTPETTYYYQVTSVDANGNIATSTEQSLVTLAE